jgi:hypothetical protein
MRRDFLLGAAVPLFSATLIASCSLVNAPNDVQPGPGETGGGNGQGGDPTTSTTTTSSAMTTTSAGGAGGAGGSGGSGGSGASGGSGGGGPMCGDGVTEGNETCDPPASCPTQCDDGDACTVEFLQGDPANCTSECVTTEIDQCGPPDGCCLPGCNAVADPDCAVCGNGFIEAGETCDGNCPINCDDGSPCSFDQQFGSEVDCNVVCTHDPIGVCADFDGCCPPGCSLANDSDCGGTCVGNAQWMPVTCTTSAWVWSSDRDFMTVPEANAAHTLFTGLDPDYCSLDGLGWVSTTLYVMTDFGDCDTNWYHIGPGYTGNCGGWGANPVRRLVTGPNDCYPY